MAAEQITTDITELEGQRLGYYGISLTNWSGGTPEIASGSKWEDAGGLYQVTSDEPMGTVGEWGAIANGTLSFCTFSPVDLAFHWGTTAPTFSTSKNGWYLTGGSATYRCVASVLKDSVTGAYTQPTLLISRDCGMTYQGLNLGGQAANADHAIRFATDASITWDESEDKFTTDKTLSPIKIDCYKYTDAVLIKALTAASVYNFELKRPITAYLYYDCNGVGGGYAGKTPHVDLYQNGNWRTVTSITITGVGDFYSYVLQLNPGYYRLTCPDYSFGIDGSYLYCTGAWGLTTITAADVAI